MNKNLVLGMLAYVVPTFVLGFVWHLIAFAEYYEALAIYREDVIVPLGLGSMLVQAALFALIYDKGFRTRSGGASQVALYGLFGAALSWSFTTLAVAAKNVMGSVGDYIFIETAFTLLQWSIVAPLTGLAFAYGMKTQAAASEQTA